MTIQVISVILVIKLPLQPMILLILIGSKLKKNLILQDLLTHFQTHLSAPLSKSVYDAKLHSRPKPNYILDSASQDSDYQEQTQQNGDECQEHPTTDSSEENSEYEDSMCQGVPLVKCQFCAPIVVYTPFFEKYPHSDTCVCIGCGYDKVGRRYQNNQRLTKHIQYGLVKIIKSQSLV
jgi:hypothetical protein